MGERQIKAFLRSASGVVSDAQCVLRAIEIEPDSDGRVWIKIDGVETVGLPDGEGADRLLRWKRDRDRALGE